MSTRHWAWVVCRGTDTEPRFNGGRLRRVRHRHGASFQRRTPAQGAQPSSWTGGIGHESCAVLQTWNVVVISKKKKKKKKKKKNFVV
eukprot:NODE_6875_length_476_cov_343.220903.p1 GENE.NODE_6875_length_476_cov_343.220903~~NODE_6875_length_476_cov_343.220903.p1  ORF type:complete len:87 (+),score=39.43 NODE_6875_length_476_cov_343.220903:164-424(+)